MGTRLVRALSSLLGRRADFAEDLVLEPKAAFLELLDLLDWRLLETPLDATDPPVDDMVLIKPVPEILTVVLETQDEIPVLSEFDQ